LSFDVIGRAASLTDYNISNYTTVLLNCTATFVCW